MKTPETQSPDDVTFREKAAPTPKFDGLALPLALRELQSGSRNTPRPSEMTAIANRLKRIRLDFSTDEENAIDTFADDGVKPSKLDFSTDSLTPKDKENVIASTSIRETIIDNKQTHESLLSNQKCESTTPSLSLANQTSNPPLTHIESNEEKIQMPKQDPSPNPTDLRVEGTQVEETSTESVHLSSSTEDSETVTTTSNNPTSTRDDAVPSDFIAKLGVVMDGRTKRNWHERTQATEQVSVCIKNGLSDEELGKLKASLNTLSLKLDNQLDELRPSIISATLSLINDIVAANIPTDSKFANDVLPSALDLACGRSLTASDAAKTVALLLHHYPDLTSLLDDVDNPTQLLKMFEKQKEMDELSSVARERASEAYILLNEKLHGTECSTQNTLPSPRKSYHTDNNNPPKSPIHPSSIPQLPVVTPSKSEKSIVTPDSRTKKHVTILSTAKDMTQSSTPKGSKNSPTRLASRRALRASWSVRLGTPLASTRQDQEVNRSESNQGDLPEKEHEREIVTETSLTRNKKIGDGVLPGSPSPRKRKLFTEEQVEAIRRQVTDEVVQSSALQFEKERKRLQTENQKLCEELKKKRIESDELVNVMTEYEMTLKRMVSQENGSANSKQIELEAENTKLKAELLEASDAFENLKEKYELAKQTISVGEKKDQRQVTQIKDLKESMIALQKWSNDLKANTEKKLAKAFENVTSYRASFLDKQAYAEKAISDLKKVETELSKSRSELSDAAVSLKTVEEQLHLEQDARATADTQLSSAKNSVTRLTNQRDKLVKDLQARQDELAAIKKQLEKAQSDSSRLTEIQTKLDTITAEEQQLKARAYDDMLKIRDLEEQLNVKENEYIEMQQICEEAMTQLEEMKVKKVGTTSSASIK